MTRRPKRKGSRKNARPSLVRTLLPVLAIVLLLGVIIISCQLMANPQAPVLPASPQQVQRIYPAEARALVDEGKALLVDVRGRPDYAAKHAEGALSFPEDEIDPLVGTLPEDRELVFYCT